MFASCHLGDLLLDVLEAVAFTLALLDQTAHHNRAGVNQRVMGQASVIQLQGVEDGPRWLIATMLMGLFHAQLLQSEHVVDREATGL